MTCTGPPPAPPGTVSLCRRIAGVSTAIQPLPPQFRRRFNPVSTPVQPPSFPLRCRFKTSTRPYFARFPEGVYLYHSAANQPLKANQEPLAGVRASIAFVSPLGLASMGLVSPQAWHVAIHAACQVKPLEPYALAGLIGGPSVLTPAGGTATPDRHPFLVGCFPPGFFVQIRPYARRYGDPYPLFPKIPFGDKSRPPSVPG